MRHPYAEPLDSLTEAEPERHAPKFDPGVFQDRWWELFEYNLYDWDNAAWREENTGARAWEPVRLTHGFFQIVSPHDLAVVHALRDDGREKHWITRTRRYPNGETFCIKAGRAGHPDEPHAVLAHRELCGAVYQPRVVIDHLNGWGLDNRRGTPEAPVNLVRYTGQSVNVSNNVRERPKNKGLPRGVEPRGTKFGWIRAQRSARGVRIFRSSEHWDTPEEARTAYLAELERVYDRTVWAHNPTTVDFPAFPPLRRRRISAHVRDLRAALEKLQREIPF